jgi:hypothetical protein
MDHTDFLFAQPSFLVGVARVLDLGGTLSAHSYNESRSPSEADARAIESDWAVVGQDMREGIATVECNEQEEK